MPLGAGQGRPRPAPPPINARPRGPVLVMRPGREGTARKDRFVGDLDGLFAAMTDELAGEPRAPAEAPAPPVTFPATPATAKSSRSWRTAPLPANWTALRERTLRRDGGRCQAEGNALGAICGAKATDVDHRVPASQGGTDELENLQSLCRFHHRQKTGREGGTAAATTRPSRARPPARHPGLFASDDRH